MPHAINALPHYHNRRAWETGMVSLVTRILGKRDTFEQATAPLLRRALESGALQLQPEDLGAGEHSALLALLARKVIPTDDLGSKPSAEDISPRMPEDEQAIALFLANAGCSLTQQTKSLPGGADAMDMAMALNADQFLDVHLPAVDWQSRTLMGVPWLHYAARRAMVDTMRVLIDKGAPLDGLDDKGNTALFHASDADSVKLLLERGANPALVNAQGDLPMAFWEGTRKIKGERLSQMRAALGKAAPSLPPDQAFRQLLRVLPATTKSRLEKEIRRLRLTGAEREDGVGVVRGILDRCIPQLTVNARYATKESNQCTALLDFLGGWEDGLRHATTSELCELHLMASMWPLPEVARAALVSLEAKVPDKDIRDRALCQVAMRLQELDYRGGDSRVDNLLQWSIEQENPLRLASVTLGMAVKMETTLPSTRLGNLGQAWEEAWLRHPDHPAWSKASTVDRLVELATGRASSVMPSARPFQLAMMNMADHALSQGARVSPSVLMAAQQSSHLDQERRTWVDAFAAKVQAASLALDTPQASQAPRRPRF